MTAWLRPRRPLTWPGPVSLVGLLVALALVVWVDRAPGRSCLVEADHLVTHGFCHRVPVSVTAGSAALTDDPVRFTWNVASLVNLRLLDRHLWDLRPVTSGLDPVEVTAQEPTNNAAPTWLTVPSISANSTVTYDFYFGSSAGGARRNQGIFLSGQDEISVASHADFDVTDQLAITVEIEPLSLAGQTGVLVSRWVSNSGYRLRLISQAGALAIEAQVDGQSAAYALPSATSTEYRMEFVAPTLRILENGTLRVSSNTGLGSIGIATSTALTMGTDLDGVTLRRVRITDQLSGTESLVASWSFDPLAMTETSAIDPTYIGTITDNNGGAHNATYTFNRPQTGISVSLGAISTTGGATVSFPSNITDVFGDPLATDLFATATPNQNLPLFPIFNDVVTHAAFGVPAAMFWSALLMFAAVVFAGAVIKGTGSIPLAIAAAVIPFFIGIAAGLVQGWFVALWISILLVVFGAARWARN